MTTIKKVFFFFFKTTLTKFLEVTFKRKKRDFQEIALNFFIINLVINMLKKIGGGLEYCSF